jgi:membrane protein DedA with SNARE-associated domain
LNLKYCRTRGEYLANQKRGENMRFTIKKFLLQAVVGFALWTGFLTPYMLFVTRVTFEQYLFWLLMQAILVPLIAPIVFRATVWCEKKFLANGKADDELKVR